MSQSLSPYTSSAPMHLETRSPHESVSDVSNVRAYILFGGVALSILAGAAGYWSVSAKLDGAVIAPASFVVESNRKTVQHLEGGIVRDLLVKEGDTVRANQVLLRMDSTDSDISVDVLGNRLAELYVRQARLVAELESKDAFEFAASENPVVRDLDSQKQSALIEVQRALFNAQRRARKSEKELVAQRIQRFQEEIDGLQDQRASNARQVEIIKLELAALEDLLRRELTTARRVNSLRREAERLHGADARFVTSQVRAGNQIDELKISEIGQARQRREAIATELAAIETQVSSIEPQYYGAKEKLKRVEVVAPVSGRVVNMQVYTKGGVIRSGDAILDIVPESDDLVVEARVETKDIEKLKVGQATRVRLTAFDETEVPEANGKIVDLSADALKDERSGEEYYAARIRLSAVQPDEVRRLQLLPGMPADVFVNTGSRTALSYFLQPLNDRLARTFVQ